MLISCYRKSIYLLLCLLVISDICSAVFARLAYDITTTVFTAISCIALLALMVLLVFRKGDWVFRIVILVPVVGWLIFKLCVLYEFLTQVD